MYTWLNINFMNDQVRYIGSNVSLVFFVFYSTDDEITYRW
jgi:hypothetical protein